MGSLPCRDGGKLPLRDADALVEPKYSTLRLSSVGECTETASCHDKAEGSGREATSFCVNAKLAKLLAASGSARRVDAKFVDVKFVDVKFEVVGSSNGFESGKPATDDLETGKKFEDVPSANC